MIRSLCLPEEGGWTNSSWQRGGGGGGGIRKEGCSAQTSPINGVKHDTPLPLLQARMSLCGVMVTASVFADADVIVGLALNRVTSVWPEDQEMRPAVYTHWFCIWFIYYTLTHRNIGSWWEEKKENWHSKQQGFFEIHVANDGGKTLPPVCLFLFPKVLLSIEPRN